MRLEEITFGEEEYSKKEAIQKSQGNQVILRDAHQGLVHGKILTNEHDNQTYKIKIYDGRGRIVLHYHDLKSLAILRNVQGYKIPEENQPI